MSTVAKFELGIGIPLGFTAVSTGLGFGIKHLIRKYEECYLFKHIQLQRESEGNFVIKFLHDVKNKMNFEAFGYKFFFALRYYPDTKKLEYYLVCKKVSFETKNDNPLAQFGSYDFGDLEHHNKEGCPSKLIDIWKTDVENVKSAAEHLANKIFGEAKKNVSEDLKRIVKGKILTNIQMNDYTSDVRLVGVEENQIDELKEKGFEIIELLNDSDEISYDN